jgi:hypothetical protein
MLLVKFIHKLYVMKFWRHQQALFWLEVVICNLEFEAIVNTKYKIVAKKVRPMATQLLPDTNDYVQQAN